MKIDYVSHSTCSLSSLNYGEIFSLDNELYIKVNGSSTVSMWAVALRNGNLVPFSNDPIVIWEDAYIKKRR